MFLCIFIFLLKFESKLSYLEFEIEDINISLSFLYDNTLL